MMSLNERRGLLWFRKHGPTTLRFQDPDCPTRHTFEALVKARLIGLEPNRKRFDSPLFVLTDEGRKALEP